MALRIESLNNKICRTGLVLNALLYEADDSYFRTRDSYGHQSAVTGALWRPGGRYFDGVDDKINLPDAPALSPTSQITLEVWFNPARNSTYDRILSKLPNNLKGWSVYHVTSIGFQLWTGSSLGSTYSVSGVISSNTWYHVACVYDGSFMIIYLDGNITGTPTARTGSISYSALQPAIGADNESANDQFFNGIIGEARIYSRALTPSEILQNFLNTKWRYK